MQLRDESFNVEWNIIGRWNLPRFVPNPYKKFHAWKKNRGMKRSFSWMKISYFRWNVHAWKWHFQTGKWRHHPWHEFSPKKLSWIPIKPFCANFSFSWKKTSFLCLEISFSCMKFSFSWMKMKLCMKLFVRVDRSKWHFLSESLFLSSLVK